MSSEVRIAIHVRDLTHADLPHCGWSGSPQHLRTVAHELDRVAAGVAEYLAVCVAKSDRPVAIGGVDYERRPPRRLGRGGAGRDDPALRDGLHDHGQGAAGLTVA